MNYQQLPDEELMARIKMKETEALAVFYDRHSAAAYQIILRIVRSPEIANELLQESFWQLWRKADSFSASGAPTAWFFRIVRNKSLDLLRRQKARPEAIVTSSDEAEDALWAQLPQEGESVPDQVHRQWQSERLRAALLGLPTDQRECVELAFFHGLSQRQIAERTNTPLGTVKTRTRLAMDKLHRELAAAINESE